MAGHVKHMTEMMNTKPEGEGPLGRPWRRWENNIKIDRIG